MICDMCETEFFLEENKFPPEWLVFDEGVGDYTKTLLCCSSPSCTQKVITKLRESKGVTIPIPNADYSGERMIMKDGKPLYVHDGWASYTPLPEDDDL